METVTYPYGTTPHKVILERWDAALDELADEMEFIHHDCWLINRNTERDELVTVLDALRVAGDLYGSDTTHGQVDCRELRMEALEALGIDERGQA